MKKQFLETGKIVTTHAVRGEVRVQAWSDSPEDLLDFEVLYLDDKGQKPMHITSARVHKNVVVMKFEGINSIEEATPYIGKVLYMDRDDVILEEGVNFVADLIGLKVIHAETKKEYGELVDVTESGANDVYHIKTAEGKLLLAPAIDEVVKSVDIDGGVMEIIPLAGLFDDED